MTTAPAPLEWHPAYRDQPWLLDWLEERGGYPYPTHQIRLSIRQPIRFTVYDPAAPLEPELGHRRVRVLTKDRAIRAAPYVGRPFRYEWFYAVDDLGRAIGGELRVRHASPDFTFCYGSFEYAQDARNGHDPDTPVWP